MKDFDITLLWDRFPKAKNYQIKIYKTKKAKKPLFQKKITQPTFLIKKKIFSGTIYYDVETKLDSGFQVRSKRNAFRYDFLPPIPSFPKEDSRMTTREIAKDKNQILFTWVKTHFTEYYEFELAKDSKFRRKVLTKKVQENFTTVENPGSGKFWWRVRSYAKGLKSPPTPAFTITISP